MAYGVASISPILNGDNFKHIISFSDIINGIRTIIPIDNVNITATYSIQDSLKTYVASKVGTVFTNCILDTVNNKLKVIFENYNLDYGVLHCNITISIPDTDYPDGYATYNRYVCVGVNLVNQDYFING